ncbi:MAG: DUF4157 domain-containing protein [Myxococcales bacterium]|nr:DUF4157 domain-containing protein [Myxococcales bacterium]
MQLPAPNGGGAPLDAAIREPMEAAFGASFEEVRVHHDGAAEALGALAFTRGRDIHFAPGAFAPRSHAGLALLGHELAHVQQQRAGRVAATQRDGAIHHDVALEAEADRLGALAAAGEPALVSGAEGGSLTSYGDPIQAKLNWARNDLVRRSGNQKWFRSSAWNKMLKRLDKYNERATDTKNDVPYLESLQDACIKWIERHNDELPYEPKNKNRPNSFATVESLRGMIERIAYAEIPSEIGSLTSGLRGGEAEKEPMHGGAISSVSLTRFNNVGKAQHVFKDELPSAKGHFDTEIAYNNNHHPLFESRAVASWLVDKLTGGGVLTPTEFAQRKGKKGAMIRGTAAKFVGGSAIQTLHTSNGVNFATYAETDFTDPQLQRQLATLQILDALSGQEDRHAGNFIIDKEGGETRVHGIDNDMAFGQKRTSVDGPMFGSDKFLGMPPFVDETFGNRVLFLQESDLREALRPLLPPNAVNAAVERLRQVQLELRHMKQTGRFLGIRDWNETTSNRHTRENSYLGRTRDLTEAAKGEGRFIPRGNTGSDTQKARTSLFGKLRTKLEVFRTKPAETKNLVESGQSKDFTATSAEQLAEELYTAIEILKSEFEGMGADSFFQEIERLIHEHLVPEFPW